MKTLPDIFATYVQLAPVIGSAMKKASSPIFAYWKYWYWWTDFRRDHTLTKLAQKGRRLSRMTIAVMIVSRFVRAYTRRPENTLQFMHQSHR